MTGPVAQVISVGPSLARALLDAGPPADRPIDRLVVLDLVEAILGDRWELRINPIAIGSDGRVVNGQHRLTAISIADRECLAVVTWGIGK